MGVVTLWYLDDGIATAKWLTQDEKTVLAHHIAVEKKAKTRHSLKDCFVEWRVWIFGIVYFCFVAGLYGLSFWLPQMIKSTGIKSAFTIGLLTAIPNAVAIAGMLLAGRSSDRTLERRWHCLVCGIIAGLGLGFSAAYGANTWISVTAATVGMVGIMACLSIFWSVPTAILSGTAAAGGIALVNSMGNLSGFRRAVHAGVHQGRDQEPVLGPLFIGCTCGSRWHPGHGFCPAALKVAEKTRIKERILPC